VLILIFRPKWYQTLWFKLAICLLAGALLYGVYLYRIGQIQAQQKIRKDIASDLHDDLGSLLNTVKIFTHLAKREPQESAHLDHIEDSVTQATLGLRDMLWVLDDSRDTVGELVSRIRKFATPVASASEMQLTCTLQEELREQALSKIEKRYLLIIAKEVINNSLKYAMCRNMVVDCRWVDARVRLSFTDDGRGFDLQQVTDGNGLKNIRHRSQQIRYDIRIHTTPGEGTTIELFGP
jgi:signal transduction histidine kinase